MSFLVNFWLGLGNPRHIATKSQHLWAVPRQIRFWSILKKSWDWVRPPPPSLGQIPNFYRKFVLHASLSHSCMLCFLCFFCLYFYFCSPHTAVHSARDVLNSVGSTCLDNINENKDGNPKSAEHFKYSFTSKNIYKSHLYCPYSYCHYQ